jgi:hypothetical protein
MEELFESSTELIELIGAQSAKLFVFNNLTNNGFSHAFSVATRMSSEVREFTGAEVIQKNLKPKNQLTAPLCRSTGFTDETIFEDPEDATKRFFLPRYRLAETIVSGQPRRQISLEFIRQNWYLILTLEAYPAPTIATQVREAKPLSPKVRLWLKARHQTKEISLEFQEITQTKDKLQALLRLDTLEQRDLVYYLLTNADCQARLVAQRIVTIAVPIDLNSAFQPVTVQLFSEAEATVSESQPGTNLSSGDWLDVAPPNHFASGTASKQNRAYFRFNLNSLPNNVSVSQANFKITSSTGFAYGGDGNQYLDFVANDQWQESVLTWNNQPALETNLGVWWTWYGFPKGKNLEDRSFEVNVTESVKNQMVGDRQLSVGIRSPGYWVRYYSRKSSNTNYRPQLVVTYTSLFEESPQELNDTIDDTFFFPASLYEYVFRQLIVEAKRTGLEQRLVNWKGTWHHYYQDIADRNRFYYLPDHFELGTRSNGQPAMTLRFEMPKGSTQPEEIQVRLQYYAKPIVDPKRLEAASEALRQYVPSHVLSDQKRLEFPPLLIAKSLKFDLELPQTDAESGSVQRRTRTLHLQDGILETVTLTLQDFQAVWEAMFSDRAEETLLTGAVEIELEGFDKESIPVQLRLSGDRETLLNAVLVTDSQNTYSKAIQVKTMASVFQPPVGREQEQIVAILVDFEQSDTVELNAQILSATARVMLSIQDHLLNRTGFDRYRYKLQVIRRNGNRTEKIDTTSQEILYPEVRV